ncbi:hypothetical protein [Hymenobacter sp. YC55]|uniref:hypothetical protein n=1 Tax=Hymenobacter sp. YC55 TaxID=3034019 RepID=UPI0023F7C19C|nr:hypothetical protein [Hymenobacter sp. YC55]MDF7815249.1 hypothetical protein [Hymenobacter sp. YC55]
MTTDIARRLNVTALVQLALERFGRLDGNFPDDHCLGIAFAIELAEVDINDIVVRRTAQG